MGVNPIVVLYGMLAFTTTVYVAGWIRLVRRSPTPPGAAAPEALDDRAPTALQIGIGAVTNFFDTLGIGSFATTTALYRLKRVVPDRIIPGTLNAGHTLPVVAQAFIYTSIIEVDALTLVAMIAAAVAGAWLGAGVVAGWPRQRIQVGMGLALVVAATLMLMAQFDLFPAGGEALGVRGTRLGLALAGNFTFGALMTLGIGLYAPCMILVSLLGMDPKAAFPIMMGSCAFLMPVGSLRFIGAGSYSRSAALGLTLGGVPAVLLAAYVVKSLPLGAVRWLVITVVFYTATGLLRAAWVERRAAPVAAAEPTV